MRMRLPSVSDAYRLPGVEPATRPRRWATALHTVADVLWAWQRLWHSAGVGQLRITWHASSGGITTVSAAPRHPSVASPYMRYLRGLRDHTGPDPGARAHRHHPQLHEDVRAGNVMALPHMGN